MVVLLDYIDTISPCLLLYLIQARWIFSDTAAFEMDHLALLIHHRFGNWYVSNQVRAAEEYRPLHLPRLTLFPVILFLLHDRVIGTNNKLVWIAVVPTLPPKLWLPCVAQVRLI
jgi:hypothetical protein